MNEETPTKMTLEAACEKYLGFLVHDAEMQHEAPPLYVIGVEEHDGSMMHMASPIIGDRFTLAEKLGVKLGIDKSLGCFKKLDFFLLASTAYTVAITKGNDVLGDNPTEEELDRLAREQRAKLPHNLADAPNRKEVIFVVGSDGKKSHFLMKELAPRWDAEQGRIVKDVIDFEVPGVGKVADTSAKEEISINHAAPLNLFFKGYNRVLTKWDTMPEKLKPLVSEIVESNKSKKYEQTIGKSESQFRIFGNED